MEGFIFQPESQPRKTGRKLVLLVLGLALVGAVSFLTYSKSKPSLLLSQYALEQQEFSSYLHSHHKQYSSDSEYEYRFQVYRENTAVIRAHNSLNSGLILGANKFADLSREEFKAMYTREIQPREMEDYEEQPSFFEANPLEAPNLQVDWRDQGAVTDVIDQGPNCFSSWAIGGVGAIEGAWKIAGNQLTDLSVQQIVSCQNDTGNYGCAGGIGADVFTYVMKNNITSDQVYPYKAINGTCNTAVLSQTAATVKSYTVVVPKNQANVIAAVAFGPVVSAVDAEAYVWQFYQQGVINNFCGNTIDHWVLIVGLNYQTGNYYICKNSWGQDWGESGYVRIAIGTGFGTCGIQTLASFPNITNT